MLSVCRQTLNSSLKRVSTRCIGSVVRVEDIKEFKLRNEPVLQYLKGSKERDDLIAALKTVSSEVEEVPIIIGDKEYTTQDVRYQVMPHDHQHKIAKFYYANDELVKKAITCATEAQKTWDKTPFAHRLDIWEKAACLMADKYRQTLNATTMLGQSKTTVQGEIDAACELIDFFRINAYFVKEALKYQPISENTCVTQNFMRYRGFDGFVAAVSPFNFTAIGGNLAYTPALMGNSVLWKPSDTALLSNWTIFKILREAGMPPGVINFIPADGPVFGDTITSSAQLAGINFTGSVPTFNRLWKQVGNNMGIYKNFPRLVGECGGKNFHFVHSSADVQSVITGTIRSAFEYCGQKCSACSRMYVPESLWDKIKPGLLEERSMLKIGDPTEFDTFAGAVIDATAFARIKKFITHAKNTPSLKIIGGGKTDDSVGYFVQPTIVESQDPKDKIMTDEIFGPVLAVHIYKDKDAEKTLKLVESSTPYALTGAVFSQDVPFLKKAVETLKMSAGNFYINDKSTGSVVGQQPFGGSRMSGTNDKAGGPYYALRWGNPQAIKETYVPLREISYPYMCD